MAYAASGDRRAALQILAELKRRAATELVPPFFVAEVYAGLGDVTRGLEALNRGIDERDIYLPENFWDPLLDPLRRDSRFARVLARMGLEKAR